MPITAVYGAVITLLVVALGTHVSLGRLRRIDGEALRQRVRVHGNLVESAPLFVVLLAVAEGSGGDARVLHGLGAGFVVARLSHAFGMLRTAGRSVPRFLGISATWTLLSLAAGYAVWVAWT